MTIRALILTLIALAALVGLPHFASAQVNDDDDAPVARQTAPDNASEWQAGHTIVNPAVKSDTSAPLSSLP